VGLSAACGLLLSLGTDEAWVLQGMRTWLEAPRAHYTSSPSLTSGGLYSLANVLIEWACGNQVWAHRMFSWGCLMLLLLLVASRGAKVGRSPVAALVGVAPLIGVPGLAENSAAAMGTACGVMLLVLATWIWGERRSNSPGIVIVCGVLYGLAAAARFELILAVPAVLLAGCFAVRNGPGLRLRVPMAELAVAVLVAAMVIGNYLAHVSVAPSPKFDRRSASLLEDLKSSTGLLGPSDLGKANIVARLVDYPRLLNKVKVAQEFCPLPLLVLASLVPFALAMEGEERSAGLVRSVSLLTLIGWTLWLGWMLRAPVPHLRYIMAALVCFAIVGGVGMARLYGWAQNTGHEVARAGLLLIAIAAVCSGVGPTFRSVVHGELDIQSFEWAGTSRLDYFRRFQHVQDQRAAMACILRNVPEEALLLTPTQPYIFRYLLSRPVVGVEEFGPDVQGSRRPTYLILSPPVQDLNAEGYLWIEQNCRLVCQAGRYSVYELLNALPENLAILVGRNAGHPLSEYWFGLRPFKLQQPTKAKEATSRPAPTRVSGGTAHKSN
jgi:hypothetical protein